MNTEKIIDAINQINDNLTAYSLDDFIKDIDETIKHEAKVTGASVKAVSTSYGKAFQAIDDAKDEANRGLKPIILWFYSYGHYYFTTFNLYDYYMIMDLTDNNHELALSVNRKLMELKKHALKLGIVSEDE